MFNWASCFPRFGSTFRKGTERSGWTITLLIVRVWAAATFVCLSSLSIAQSTKLVSEPARLSLISASLAPAVVVNNKVVSDKPAVELKLPKAVQEALTKGTPDYGVKLEVLRAVKLKPTEKIGVSSRALDNLANPQRTHQVEDSGTPAIGEKANKPAAAVNGSNDTSVVARSIRIKSPGEQALDSIDPVLPSVSRASENGAGSKVFATRRVGSEFKATKSALVEIEREVELGKPDAARPGSDQKIIKQQQVKPTNRGQVRPELATGETAVAPKVSVDRNNIEKQATVDVDQDSIKKQATVDVDQVSIKKQATVDVDQDSIEKQAAVDRDSIEKKAAVDQDSIKKKAVVDTQAIEKKGTVDLSDQFTAINKAASGGISGAISSEKPAGTASVSADGMDSSIVNSDSVTQSLRKQAATFKAQGNAKAVKRSLVAVPAVTQDCAEYHRHWAGLGSKHCNKYVDNPASVAAHSTALANRKTLLEQSKADINAGKKIDKKADDIAATQGGYTSKDALPASAVYGGVVAPDSGPEQDKPANQSDTQGHRNNHHNPHALNHDSSTHRILELSSVIDDVIAIGDINASIGADSDAIQQIATVQGNVTGYPSFNVVPITTRSGLVNASIGYKSLASQMIDQLGNNDRDTFVPNGAVTFSGETVGGVNASIGSDSKAYHLQSLVSGRFRGANVVSMSDGFVNASIGDQTTSKLRLSVFEGQTMSGSLDLMSAAAGIVVAAIGHKSTANFSAASGENVTSVGNVKLHATAPGAIVASIGSGTAASTLLASATGASANAIDVSVIGLLPSIAAAIGVNAQAHNAVAVLRENVEVGGKWTANITYGQLTAFSLGNSTHATNEIGVISANVSGAINQEIVVGAMLAGTLGSNTEATNKVGNIEARVNGNVTTNINIVDVNTLSLGLSLGATEDIYARTLIGNVFPGNSGGGYGTISKNITVTGPIVNLGIGLIIDLGFLGVLDLSSAGCVNIGNTGPSQC